MNRVMLVAFLLLAMTAPAWAVFPDVETFDNDQDGPFNQYTPLPTPGYSASDDFLLDGDPPPIRDWEEIRNGGNGVIEEVPNGFGGVVAPRGPFFGFLDFYSGDGPQGHPAAQVAPLGVPWSYQVDLYTDPTQAPSLGAGGGGSGNGSDGIPDFWWTNAVQDGSGSGPFGNYLTETGFTAEILRTSLLDPGVWRLTTTTGGEPAVDIPVGNWVTLEIEYHDNGIDGELAATHRVWDSTRNVLLYSDTLDHLFLNPDSSSLGGPLYTWFTYGQPNIERLLIDEIGVAAPIAPVPEPSSLALAGVSLAGMLVYARRRRR